MLLLGLGVVVIDRLLRALDHAVPLVILLWAGL